jgi:hypothetical protein
VRSQYQVAYLFSTKNDASVDPFQLELTRRFFGSHIECLLSWPGISYGKIVFWPKKKWVAVR